VTRRDPKKTMRRLGATAAMAAWILAGCSSDPGGPTPGDGGGSMPPATTDCFETCTGYEDRCGGSIDDIDGQYFPGTGCIEGCGGLDGLTERAGCQSTYDAWLGCTDLAYQSCSSSLDECEGEWSRYATCFLAYCSGTTMDPSCPD